MKDPVLVLALEWHASDDAALASYDNWTASKGPEFADQWLIDEMLGDWLVAMRAGSDPF